MNFFRQKNIFDNKKLFGMGVSLEKGDEQIKLIDELGVDYILIRFPLEFMDKIDEYEQFVKKFPNKKILLNILQNRENIEDLTLFEKNITKIFTTFSPYIKEFQIANAINRTKWGFFGIAEYLDFFAVAQKVRDEKFQNLTLLGPPIIDFEYYYTIRALFNLKKIKFDKISSLLYVDRRGAPKNKQYLFFDTPNKIKLLHTLAVLSPKTKPKIIITEVNWPISDTAPYAPTSQKECVNEEDYANFMVKYYLLAISTGQVETIYWHQLIATGYGLIDNRGEMKKRKAFKAFATMVKILKNATFISFGDSKIISTMKFKTKQKLITIYWSDESFEINLSYSDEVLDLTGEVIKSKTILIKKNIIYSFTNL